VAKRIAHAPGHQASRRLGVVIVEPLPVVRAGLALLIDGADDLEVLAEVGDADQGEAAIAKLRRVRTVALVSLSILGDHDAAWLIRTLRERYPRHVVLAQGADAEPTAISRCLFVGADGYVDKNVPPEAFLNAIRQAGANEMVLVGPGLDELGRIADGIDANREVHVRLTEREREVLTVAAEGLTARQIARRLGVQERTVTTHLGRIYGKLGVGNRLAAIRLAARSGLVSVGGPK
jgi:DNA-binding NarL/FixJ family response regulator